jgi:hypothetical protein
MSPFEAWLRAKLFGPQICGLEVRENGMLIDIAPAVHD